MTPFRPWSSSLWVLLSICSFVLCFEESLRLAPITKMKVTKGINFVLRSIFTQASIFYFELRLSIVFFFTDLWLFVRQSRKQKREFKRQDFFLSFFFFKVCTAIHYCIFQYGLTNVILSRITDLLGLLFVDLMFLYFFTQFFSL